MLKKIGRIKNFGVFQDFSWDASVLDEHGDPYDFAKVNIIYGRNYSGKTTVSRVLRSFETESLPANFDSPMFTIMTSDGTNFDQTHLSDCDLDVRVFNQDFIHENLRFLYDPEGDVSAFAILGADNSKIEQQIKSIKDELGSDKDGEESGLYAELTERDKVAKQIKQEYEIARRELDNKLAAKATGRETGIKYRAQRFGDQNYNITKLTRDIDAVLAPDYTVPTSTELEIYESTISVEAKPEVKFGLSPQPKIHQLILKTKELLERQIASSNKIAELLRDSVLNAWVKQGIELNHGKECCGFCGNPISNERWQLLNSHFDEESKQLIADIDACIVEMESEKQKIQSAMTFDKNEFYPKFHSRLDEVAKSFEQEAGKYAVQINALIQQLRRKREHITVPMQVLVPEGTTEVLTGLYENYVEICKEHNEYSIHLDDEREIAQKALRLYEVFDFQSSIDYGSAMEKVEQLWQSKNVAKNRCQECLDIITEKKEKIASLTRQLRDEETAAMRINEYLSNYFGHESLVLRTVNSDGANVCFEILRDGEKAFNLSEGECSLIAFCYFMARLSADMELQDNLVIWIDDPISSLDGNHVFFVYSLIRAEIVTTKNYGQLFISTHNLNFLKYLRRITGKDKDKNVRYFLINRRGKKSTIQKMPDYLEKFVTEFNFLFSEIYKCSGITEVNEKNYVHFYNFGNNARKFLEILLFYYYPDDTKPLDKLEKFFGKGLVPACLTDRINNEYSHLVGIFERGQQPIEVPEMQKTAKLIVETMQRKHPDQYYALLRSIGEDTSSAS